MPKTYSDRVMRFRRGVYGNRRRITSGCQLLLLRLSDSMDAKGIVSVPRSTLAEDLDCPPARISEWVKEAKATGFLSIVRRARPQVTAVYQGLYVAPAERYAPAYLRGTDLLSSGEVRRGVPQIGGSEVRPAPHPREQDSADRTDSVVHLQRRGNDEEEAGCPAHAASSAMRRLSNGTDVSSSRT